MRRKSLLVTFSPRTRFWFGIVLPVLGAAAVTAILWSTGPYPAVIPGLLLLIPVTAAGLLGGWFSGVVVTVAATLGFLVLLPPAGSLDLSGTVPDAEGAGAVSVPVVLLAFVGVSLALVRQTSWERRQRRRAESEREQLAFLATASEWLHGTLDANDALERVANLAVPRLADWCAIDVVRDDGSSLELVALTHSDPEQVAVARRFREDSAPNLGVPGGVWQAIREGRSIVVPRMTRRILRAGGQPPEQIELAQRLGLRSAIVAPLKGESAPLGALTLVMAESGRRYVRADLSFVEDLALRAATAVENARRYGERSRIATTLQRSLLPEALPDIPFARVAHRYQAAAEDVGGDFYDALRSGPRSWAVFVGDVCGRGVDAAALTALARHTVRTAALLERGPAEALRILNEAILRRGDPASFCTLVYACLYPSASGVVARIACGGHPPPLVLRADGSVDVAGEPGTLLGVIEDVELPEVDVRLSVGDVLLLYTDGLIEAGGQRSLGVEGLAHALRHFHGQSPESTVEGLVRTAATLSGDRPRDDLAVVAIEVVRPEPVSESAATPVP